MPDDIQPRKGRPLNPERGAGRIARNRMRIAWMYYVEGLTQNEIADRLGIGRVTVVRNINEAIKQREVKIWIEGEVSECFELEGALTKAFGNPRPVVQSAMRQHDQKLLAPPPSKYITSPQAGSHDIRQFGQHLIADVVSIRVVHVLEIVEIEHDQAKRITMPFCQCHMV